MGAEYGLQNFFIFVLYFFGDTAFCQGNDYVYAAVVIVTVPDTWHLSRELAQGSTLQKKAKKRCVCP